MKILSLVFMCTSTVILTDGSAVVDEVKAALGVLEAKQVQLQQQLENMQQQQHLQARIQAVLQAELEQKTEELERQRHSQAQLQTHLDATVHELRELQTWKNQSVSKKGLKEDPKPSFHAHLAEDLMSYTGRLRPWLLFSGGWGFNPDDGIFYPPVAGTYCFMASAGTLPGSEGLGIYLGIWTRKYNDYVGKAMAYSGPDGPFVSGTTQAVVHLDEGQPVELHSLSVAGGYADSFTSFTGFLLYPD